MKYLWTWGGIFFGYKIDDLLYTYKGKCVGRFNENIIYGRDGRYLGELLFEERLITDKLKKHWCGISAPNIQGPAVGKLLNQVSCAMISGYEDFPGPDKF